MEKGEEFNLRPVYSLSNRSPTRAKRRLDGKRILLVLLRLHVRSVCGWPLSLPAMQTPV
jgi:hypothetical protein